MSIRVYYQVLNDGNMPASGLRKDLAIFPSRATAEDRITYLVDDCGYEDEFKIREVIVSLPLTYPGGEDEL